MKYITCFACGLILLTAIQIHAQEADIKDYLTRSGMEGLLYAGKEDVVYNYPRLRGHPYLDTDRYREGTLSFDGRLYHGVLLRLNTHTDELSVFLPGNFSVIVPSNMVDYALLPDYTIVYRSRTPGRDELRSGVELPAGYYACIPMKKYPVFRREVRYPERRIEGMQTEWNFKVHQSRLYIYKDGLYHPVGSKNSVLKLFGDKKMELNQYAR